MRRDGAGRKEHWEGWAAWAEWRVATEARARATVAVRAAAVAALEEKAEVETLVEGVMAGVGRAEAARVAAVREAAATVLAAKEWEEAKKVMGWREAVYEVEA
jgi:hypothetical protein